MTPADVRDRLLAIGVDLSGYTNPLSAIHTVLKRLRQAGELRLAHTSASGRTYVWSGRPIAAAVGAEEAAARAGDPGRTPTAARRRRRR
jgi:hypothetical protein